MPKRAWNKGLKGIPANRPKNGATLVCAVCAANFYVPASRLRDQPKYCSRTCYFAGRWGESHRVTRACRICDEQFTVYASSPVVTCSKRCASEDKSRRSRGELSVLWRGGFHFPYVGTWRRQRLLALERDGRKCVLCGNGARPEVHHIQPARYGGGHDLDNLITLCRSCHAREEMKVNAHYRATLLHGRPPRKDRGQAA